LLFACAGCADPGDRHPALVYLGVGIDPSAEADARALALARAGYLITARIDGRTFVALAATRNRDRASVVRVFTSRGTALGLDAPDPRFPGRLAVGLYPARAPFDLDGDPHEELAVAVEAEGRRCLGLLRIEDGGFPRELSLPLTDLPGAPCAEAIEDVAGDPVPEVIARVRFDGLGLETAPEVSIVLMGRAEGFHLLPPGLARAHYAPLRQAREDALAQVGEDGQARLRIALELAAITRFEQRDTEAQLEAFDHAIAGLAEELEPLARELRAFVAAGFRPE
jgi:hypothetical protein